MSNFYFLIIRTLITDKNYIFYRYSTIILFISINSHFSKTKKADRENSYNLQKLSIILEQQPQQLVGVKRGNMSL